MGCASTVCSPKVAFRGAGRRSSCMARFWHRAPRTRTSMPDCAFTACLLYPATKGFWSSGTGCLSAYLCHAKMHLRLHILRLLAGNCSQAEGTVNCCTAAFFRAPVLCEAANWGAHLLLHIHCLLAGKSSKGVVVCCSAAFFRAPRVEAQLHFRVQMHCQTLGSSSQAKDTEVLLYRRVLQIFKGSIAADWAAHLSLCIHCLFAYL